MDVEEARELAAQRYGAAMGYSTREDLEFCRYYVRHSYGGALLVLHEQWRDFLRTLREALPGPVRRLLG